MSYALRATRIYLDSIATTPVAPEVIAAMAPFWSEKFGNPSSIHEFGRAALIAVDDARDIAARFFGCRAGEVFFTGSATESDNWALYGIARGAAKKFQRPLTELHIVTSAIEHAAVLEAARRLEGEGVAVTYVKPTKEGIVTAASVAAAIKPNTVLVSVMYVNNEVGSMQPIAEIGQLIKREREVRSMKHGVQATKSENPILHTSYSLLPLYLHSDAVQAVQFLDCSIDKLGVDALTFSGHKIYGPKGVGGLIVREKTPLAPLIVGGGQENEKRSGTENVPAIVGLGRALQLAEERRTKNEERLSRLQALLLNGILERVPDARLNGPALGERRIVNNVNVCFKAVEGQTLLIALDLAGVAASSGSACAAGAAEPSHVLLAMGLSASDARASIRFGLSRYTTASDIKTTLEILPKLVAQARRA